MAGEASVKLTVKLNNDERVGQECFEDSIARTHTSSIPHMNNHIIQIFWHVLHNHLLLLEPFILHLGTGRVIMWPSCTCPSVAHNPNKTTTILRKLGAGARYFGAWLQLQLLHFRVDGGLSHFIQATWLRSG